MDNEPHIVSPNNNQNSQHNPDSNAKPNPQVVQQSVAPSKLPTQISQPTLTSASQNSQVIGVNPDSQVINSTKSNKKSFLVAISVLVVVGGIVVFLVAHGTNNHSNPSQAKTASSSKASTANLKSYTSSSKIYSLSYPSSWTLNKQPVQKSSTDPFPLADPNATQLIPPEYIDGNSFSNAVIIEAYTTNDTTKVLKTFAPSIDQSQIKASMINGYQSMFVEEETAGNENSASSTQDTYAITNNDTTLLIKFTVKQGGNAASGVKAFDATSELPQVTSIINSIKFAN